MKTTRSANLDPRNVPQAQIDEATRLGTINGNRPVVGWFRYSPRRGSHGIRFFPVGVEPMVQDLGQGVTFYPVVAF